MTWFLLLPNHEEKKTLEGKEKECCYLFYGDIQCPFIVSSPCPRGHGGRGSLVLIFIGGPSNGPRAMVCMQILMFIIDAKLFVLSNYLSTLI